MLALFRLFFVVVFNLCMHVVQPKAKKRTGTKYSRMRRTAFQQRTSGWKAIERHTKFILYVNVQSYL